MILPIYAYGQPVLKKVATDLQEGHPGLDELVRDMWETMYHAHGIGLAGPQVGIPYRIFVVDTSQVEEEEKAGRGIKQVFLNARIMEETGKPWSYEEGCLSIPDIRGDVERLSTIRMRWQDLTFQWHEQEFSGLNARVIQHEYDHIDGILFVERLKPLKKRLIKRKLEQIRMGEVDCDYKMKFAPIR